MRRLLGDEAGGGQEEGPDPEVGEDDSSDEDVQPLLGFGVVGGGAVAFDYEWPMGMLVEGKRVRRGREDSPECLTKVMQRDTDTSKRSKTGEVVHPDGRRLHHGRWCNSRVCGCLAVLGELDIAVRLLFIRNHDRGIPRQSTFIHVGFRKGRGDRCDFVGMFKAVVEGLGVFQTLDIAFGKMRHLRDPVERLFQSGCAEGVGV